MNEKIRVVVIDDAGSDCPTPVVMLSDLTGERAESTIKALQLSAVAFFLKPSFFSPAGENSSGTPVKKINQSFFNSLEPNGILFIGDTETMLDANTIGFERLYPCFYKKPAIKEANKNREPAVAISRI